MDGLLARTDLPAGEVVERETDSWTLSKKRRARAKSSRNAKPVYYYQRQRGHPWPTTTANGRPPCPDPCPCHAGASTARRRPGSIETTVGRIIYNQPHPAGSGLCRPGRRLTMRWAATRSTRPPTPLTAVTAPSARCGKKQLGKIIDRCIEKYGFTIATEVLDNIKAPGYKYSTIGAITISIADMTVPEKKYHLIRETEQQVVAIEKQYNGAASSPTMSATGGRCRVGKDHQGRHRRPAEQPGPATTPSIMMADSGARGSMEADPSAGRYARPDGQHRR